jgi:hypothetical protein
MQVWVLHYEKKSLHPSIPENTKNSRKICKTGKFRGEGGGDIYVLYRQDRKFLLLPGAAF